MRFRARVEVQLRPGIADPEGATIERALPALGFDSVAHVRAGRSFSFEVEAADEGAARTTATDLADYLVKRGLPFRDAHEAVAHAVRICVDRNCDLADLTLDEMRTELPNVAHLIGDDVFDYLTLEGSVASRNHPGGTAPEQVLKAVEAARANLA